MYMYVYVLCLVDCYCMKCAHTLVVELCPVLGEALHLDFLSQQSHELLKRRTAMLCEGGRKHTSVKHKIPGYFMSWG